MHVRYFLFVCLLSALAGCASRSRLKSEYVNPHNEERVFADGHPEQLFKENQQYNGRLINIRFFMQTDMEAGVLWVDGELHVVKGYSREVVTAGEEVAAKPFEKTIDEEHSIIVNVNFKNKKTIDLIEWHDDSEPGFERKLESKGKPEMLLMSRDTNFVLLHKGAECFLLMHETSDDNSVTYASESYEKDGKKVRDIRVKYYPASEVEKTTPFEVLEFPSGDFKASAMKVYKQMLQALN